MLIAITTPITTTITTTPITAGTMVGGVAAVIGAAAMEETGMVVTMEGRTAVVIIEVDVTEADTTANREARECLSLFSVPRDKISTLCVVM